jgi:hypothetical protein
MLRVTDGHKHSRGFHMRLNVLAFALAFGIFWGAAIFLSTWWMMFIHGSYGSPTFLAYFYLGFKITPVGSLIGLGWGFLDGLVCGAIFSSLYNLLAGGKSS